MNIIEKLGITPGPWTAEDTKRDGSTLINAGDYNVCACDIQEAHIIAAAPQMLEALIEMGMENTDYTSRHDRCRKAIESATGKSWEEIKTLMEDEG